MLDLMRSAQRRRWFTVGIIMFVVLSFVLAIFAIWGGAASGRTSISSGAWVVKIDGEPISAKDFDRRRSQIENRLRDRLGSDFEVQTSGLDFHQMALFQLMGQALAYNEATRLGMSATDGEIAQAVVTSPTFQRGGKFIGREAYENELRRNGFDVAEYEAQIARDLTSEKLRDLMGTLVDVTDAEVEKAFTEEGESAEVDYILFKSADFSQPGEPTAKEVEAYYRDHSRKYLTPERRSADVIVIERDPLLATIDVPEADIAAEYEKNKSTRFTGGEQRRASHILFKVAQNAPQADQDAAKAKADAVLAEAKAGKDFAELARSTSQDSSGPAGGDLGWFERGRMVPEFDSAVFSLAEGQISDVIRTQFGFHIIKVTGSRPAGVRPLEDVRAQIKQGLSFQ
ncbi:MAG TPA: peptidylprolyl isomerase, partial [Candidatus Polarisedimenticolia bacterium]|nr:peptidylprolyl isomerase [Candidatus Polarisedimenticolia bacterium]